MTKLLQIASALAIITGLMTAVFAIMYALCWIFLWFVQFFPVIGRRHRHKRWDELNKP